MKHNMFQMQQKQNVILLLNSSSDVRAWNWDSIKC